MAAAADHAVAATPEPKRYPMALDELLHRTTFEDRRQCRQAVWACAVDNVRYSLDDERAARLWLQQNGHHAQVNCSCYMVHARTMPQLELNNPHISMLQATHHAGANAASSCTSKPCALCGAAAARHKCGGCMAVRFATLLAPNTPNMPTLFAGAVVGIASGCTGGSMGGNAAW